MKIKMEGEDESSEDRQFFDNIRTLLGCRDQREGMWERVQEWLETVLEQIADDEVDSAAFSVSSDYCPSSESSSLQESKSSKETDRHRKDKNNDWFDNPKVQLRLEKLMGSHHVKITDRQFMRKLQDRIDEDHLENLFKRIRERETDEMLREKKLILDGRLSMDDIPKEMAEHPIFRISTVTDKLFGAPKKRRITHTTLARSGFKEQKSMQVVMKEKLIETTDVRETEEGMREKVVKVIEKGKVLNISAMPDEKEEEKPPEEEPPKVTIVEEQKPMSTEDAERLREVITEEEEVDKKYMYTPEQFAKIKYETALVKELKTTTGVEDLYSLAETIVRPMRVQTTSKKKEWD